MTWSFYRLDDGSLTGGSYTGPAEWLEANTPAGCAAIEGHSDAMSQRVDLATLELVDWVPSRPLDTAEATWSWDSELRRWVPTRTLAGLQADAHAAIDAAAGAARARYITDVPGQQATYLRKLEQARAFLALPAGEEGAAPPYLQAEADATGRTPRQAAQAIADTAALWDEQLGPAIEGARIGGKRAVTLATTSADVDAARDQAITTIAAI